MNTGKWGPYGWTLTHGVASRYPNNPTKNDEQLYRDFYMNLRYILPCKYCRISFTAYLKKRPLTHAAMKNNITLGKHHYDVHNLVNDKLRKQGYITYPDPKFSYIYRRYKKMSPKYMLPRIFNFIWAVTLNYSNDKTTKEPQSQKPLRFYYKKFFEHLSLLFPGTKQRNAFRCCWNKMKSHFNDYTNDCNSLSKFVYTLQMCVYSHLNIKIKKGTKFYTLGRTYNFFEKWRANCNQKTCRSPVSKKGILGYAQPFTGYTYNDFIGYTKTKKQKKCMKRKTK